MAKKTKVCYIVSDIDKAVAFEWIVQKIDKEKFELCFLLLLPPGPCFLETFLLEHKVPVKRIQLKSKKDFVTAFFSCFRILVRWNPEIVHCHLRKATLIGLFTSKLLGIRKRIYTQHHATFHHSYFPAAVKWDQLSNSLATDIVAISENVKQVLEKLEQVPLNKIHLIHHGFDLGAFSNVQVDRVEKLRKRYLPSNIKGPVVGVIGRYIHLKGHKYIIEAAKGFLAEQPDAIFVFANASGPDEKEVKEMLQKMLPSKNFVEIKFEEDLFALYKLFDIYVHAPIDPRIEAFGQTYVEALASDIPSIFTLSGVATEFVLDGENALIVPFKDSAAIKEALLKLSSDEELRKKLTENGRESVQIFDLEEFIGKLEKLYST